MSKKSQPKSVAEGTHKRWWPKEEDKVRHVAYGMGHEVPHPAYKLNDIDKWILLMRWDALMDQRIRALHGRDPAFDNIYYEWPK